MDRPSSTSSSEVPDAPGKHDARQVPWAFLLALLILLGVELTLRAQNPRKLIPWREGLEEHYSSASYIALTEPADVIFLGSSVSKVGIDAPLIRTLARQHLNRLDLAIANFAAQGTLAAEIRAVVEYMTRHGHRPQVLAIEANPRQLEPATTVRLRACVPFWDFSDWHRARKQFGEDLKPFLPEVCRTQIGEWYLTFRLRNLPSYCIDHWLYGRDMHVNPMDGEIASAPRKIKSKQSAAPKSTMSPRKQMRKMRKSGAMTYRVNQQMVDELRKALARCRRAGIHVIIYETPLSQLRWSVMPRRSYKDFSRTIQTLAAKSKCSFYTLASMGLKFEESDFADPVHLNKTGRSKLSMALAQHAIIPELIGRKAPVRPNTRSSTVPASRRFDAAVPTTRPGRVLPSNPEPRAPRQPKEPSQPPPDQTRQRRIATR